MTIDEAVKIKEEYQYILQDASLPELIEADNISIEALKWLKAYRGTSVCVYRQLLPGETKDEVTSQDIKHRLSWALDSGETKD